MKDLHSVKYPVVNDKKRDSFLKWNFRIDSMLVKTG